MNDNYSFPYEIYRAILVHVAPSSTYFCVSKLFARLANDEQYWKSRSQIDWPERSVALYKDLHSWKEHYKYLKDLFLKISRQKKDATGRLLVLNQYG